MRKLPSSTRVRVAGLGLALGLAACSGQGLVLAPDGGAHDAAVRLDARAPDLLAVPPDGAELADGSMTLAPPGDTDQFMPVDGISCDSSEQLLFHIHAYLAIYVDGAPRLLAAGIGIGPPLVMQDGVVVGGSCFSWLHTHDETGVIHIESPVSRTFTLGDFFDIWGQPLSTSQVGPAQGAVTAFLNGQPLAVDPRTLPMNAHDVLQLDVGAPVVPPQPFTFPNGL
ncbi:MAG TPA: hypothetical protein VFF06_02845 [Polyangia bacterium]|nr:hypothetical protein [Polyangia bacterium]